MVQRVGVLVVAGVAVRITTAPMTLDEVVTVAEGAPVELTDEAMDRIRASRRVLDEAIARGEAIYGATTGLGHARDERLPVAALRDLQPMLVEMHVGGTGPSLAPVRVRAGLVVRLNGFARGGAGVSLAVARGVEGLLNHGILPLIPSSGSVGAGDLGPLALVGRTLIGRGEVEVEGRRTDAISALAAAGLDPVTLEPKDALAIIASNALTTGHGALLARRTGRLLDLADLVVATSMEALRANPSVVDPAVAQARGSSGQQATSLRIRRALGGSARASGAAARSVQDPLSLRVVPQVHGACRDTLTQTSDALMAELNATADNPLVDAASERVVSNGNFHSMNVTLAVESLRLALAHVGLLVERRSGHLWEAVVTSMGMSGDGIGSRLEGGAPPELAGLGLRYPGAARYTRLRLLAQPVSLDVPPLDVAVEDHAPNTAEAATTTEEALGIVEELLVVELLIAGVLLGIDASTEQLGHGTRRLVDLLGEVLDPLPVGTPPSDVHEYVLAAVRQRSHALVDA